MKTTVRIFTAIFFVLFIISCGGGSSSSTTVSGGGGTSSDEPRLIVKRLSSVIFSGSGPYPFGNIAPLTSSTPVTFTIENNGGAALNITAASITGSDSSDFTHDITGTPTIAAGGSYSFNITFSPTSTGTKIAQINITHNDLTVTNPFVIKVTGIASTDVAEINVKDDTGNNLLSGHRDLQFREQGCRLKRHLKTFTVYNMGKATLSVTSLCSDITGTVTPCTVPNPDFTIADHFLQRQLQ